MSHSCNYPELVNSLPRVTSTHVPYKEGSTTIDAYVREHLTEHEALYDLDLEMLQDLKPDIIISQTLCDVCAVATGDVLEAIHALPGQPLLIDLVPNTLDEVIEDILRVGIALGVERPAQNLANSLVFRRKRVTDRTAAIPQGIRPRVTFLEWLIPPFNGGHWNPELVKLAGGIDLLGTSGQASSTLQWSNIVDVRPEVVFIACCGFSIDRTFEDFDLLGENESWQQLLGQSKPRIYIADGSAYFSCPSPRLFDGLEIMAHAMHPDVHPPADAGLHRVWYPE